MDKEKRIAELEERKRQIDVEIAFYNGSKIEVIIKKRKEDSWSETKIPIWDWNACDYRTAEEPVRIPFDGSDAFNMIDRKFKTKSNDEFIFRMSIDSDNYGVFFRNEYVTYKQLEKSYLIYNKLSGSFEPCNKVA